MKKIYAVIAVLLLVFVAGCWQKAKVLPEEKQEMLRAGQYPSTTVEEQEKYMSEENEPSVEKTEAPVQTVKKTAVTKTAETAPEKQECAGRLIPLYNLNNEITGYRCDTDSANFECPGHRAGETWQQDGMDCTCTDDGTISCESETK